MTTRHRFYQNSGILVFLIGCMLQQNLLTAQTPQLNLVPYPQAFEFTQGILTIDKVHLVQKSGTFSGLKLWLEKNHPGKYVQQEKNHSSDFTRIEYRSGAMPPESYQLQIRADGITISALDQAGWLYAEQTLVQLAEMNAGKFWPCMNITDGPRFKWRGMHLDESRHFLGKEYVKNYLDWLFSLKMNVFHWHLTDAHGWRIEIKKYPKLTSVAAWRPERSGIPFGEADTAKTGEPCTYGGYYTQEDIREIVNYAAERNITIIPEIEMPGHTTAALAAYPEYSCTGGPFPMPGGAKNTPYPNYCVGNPATYTFLQDILSEVMALFPSKFIHIGGDEVERHQWAACAKCQAQKTALQLKDEAQLQVYFTREIEQFLNAKGRILMGWDEIMEGGGLSSSAGVMVWRGEDQARKALEAGHTQVILTHNYYFDLYQGNPANEPQTYGYLPLEKVYQYEPAPELWSQEERSRITGIQGCLWTEQIETPQQANYMLFPRLLALAEVAWTNTANKNWSRFSQFVPSMMRWLESRQTNYATSVFDPEIRLAPDTLLGAMVLDFSQQIPHGVIRYTLDGSEPSPTSSRYERKLAMSEGANIHAKAFLENGRTSKTVTARYKPSKSTGKPFQLKALPSIQYNGNQAHVLSDGLTGSEAFHDGKWCGFYGVDLDYTLDFGAETTFQHCRVNFLEAERSWIYLPEKYTVSISSDGQQWTTIGTSQADEIRHTSTKAIKNVQVDLKGATARYIRIYAQNKGQHPVYPDGKCWIFVDEISLD